MPVSSPRSRGVATWGIWCAAAASIPMEGHRDDGNEPSASAPETVGTSVPGIAVAVVDADGVRDAVGGWHGRPRGQPAASLEMVCPWFSMTKIVTATAAMRLMERGVLDLDAPLSPHVAQMRHLRPTTDAAKITARHLLSHSGGLANPIPVGWIHPAGPARSRPRHVPRRLALEARQAPVRAGHPVELLEPRNARPGCGDGEPHAHAVHGSGAARGARAARHALHGFAYTTEMEAHAATGYHPRRSPMRFLLHRWVIGPPAGDGSRSTASCWTVRPTAGWSAR